MLINKIYNILTIRERFSFFYLLCINLLNIFFETLTIGSLIPLITTIINFEYIANNYYGIYITKIFFNDYNKENFLTVVCYVIIFLIILKVIAQTLIINYTSIIQNNLNLYFQENILKNFFKKGWNFYLKNDSSTLIRHITHEIGHIVGKIILPFIEIISEVLLVTSLMILLTIYNYKIALILFFLITLSLFAINIFTRNKIKKLSNKRYKISLVSFKTIYEIFIIIKEIIITSSGEKRLRKYINSTKKYYTYERLINIFSFIPRTLFEFFVVLIVCLILLFYSNNFNKLSEILITLSLYLATAIKLIPSASKIARNMQFIQLGMPIFNSQYENLIEIKKYNLQNHKLKFYKINDYIELKNIKFSYEKEIKNLLENINLKIEKNNIICIKGESGSGKTTLANIILGIIKPTYGKIIIDNKEINYNNEEIILNIGYVDQVSKLIDDTLENNITLGENLNYKEKIIYYNLIKKCGLAELKKNIDNRVSKNIGEDSKFISGGEKQRINIARTLFRNPQLIIFDEPTSSLDNENEKKILDLINSFKQDKFIIVITHNIKYFSKFNHIYELKNGQLIKI